MFSHVFVSVTNFDCALRFYDRLFVALGIAQRFCDPDVPWADWHSTGATRPFFVICKPFNGEPHDAGNGQMPAFLATSRNQVRQAYSVALAAGGTCEGKLGLRPQYHPDYFGAYFLDPEGNKLCVACHQQE